METLVICDHCGQPKRGVKTGLCNHCGRFGKSENEDALREARILEFFKDKDIPKQIPILSNKYLNYGIRTFISKKQLSLEQIVEWFNKYELELVLNKQGYITNANEILNKYWKAFANWVEKGLALGTLNGRRISLSNGSTEANAERAKAFEAIDEEVRKLYNVCYKNDRFFAAGALFTNFHHKNNSIRKYRVGEGDLKIQKYLKDFEQIIEDGLQDEFIRFVENK